jgi:hypothetical protein
MRPEASLRRARFGAAMVAQRFLYSPRSYLDGAFPLTPNADVADSEAQASRGVSLLRKVWSSMLVVAWEA